MIAIGAATIQPQQAPSAARIAAAAPIALGLFAFAVGLAAAAFDLQRRGFPDFEVFWTAARHATDPRLYDPAYLTAAQTWWPGDTPRPFIYPPTFLLLAWPFGRLPFQPAYFLWVGLSCAALALAAWRLIKPRWALVVLVLSLPVLMAAAYGQSVLFAAAALTGGAVALERRPALGGVLIAAAACLKPQLALLSPLLLIGHGRAFRAAALAVPALVLASLVFGPDHWRQWLAALPGFARNVRALPLKFINPLDPGLPLAAKAAVAATGLLFAVWSLRRPVPERLVGVVCGSLCCTLYAVRPDLAMLAAPATAWLVEGRSLGAWLRRLAAAALLGGVIGSPLGVVLFMLAVAMAGLPALELIVPGEVSRHASQVAS